MDYEKLIKAVNLCGSTPKVDQCKKCAYWTGGDMSKCIPQMTSEAATVLATIEDILGDEYDLDRLRDLVEATRLIGKTVYEPNKRGFISTYEVISIHISICSILVGWNLIDGVYSNLNGFEISALGKYVFLTREDAEPALRREQDG